MHAVNLLPWREWRRQRAIRTFQYGLLAAVLLGGLLVVVAVALLNQRLGAQLKENSRLDERTAGLDGPVAEVEGLVARRDELLKQRNELQALQRQGQSGAELLTHLTRIVPAQVRLDGLQLAGDELRLSGLARSGTDVAHLLRNLGQSPGLSAPDLQEVKSSSQGERFQIVVSLRPAAAVEQS